MRIAAALVGGVGALYGTLTSGVVILVVVMMNTAVGSVVDLAVLPVNLAMIGPELVVALSCATGLVGAGFLLARRSRKSVYLMLAAAVGIAVARVVQPFLVGTAGNVGIPERFTEDASLPPAEFFISTLIPAAALLLASALGTFAIRNQRVS